MKYRGKRSVDAPDYFSHPFAENNTMKLEPDLNLAKSLSIKELGNGTENYDPVEHRKQMAEKKTGKISGGRKVTVDREKRANLLRDDSDEEEESEEE